MRTHQSISLRETGFTLVELSIVLVILGLLVGGVLTGQSLIRAAELRAITREHSQYLTAVNSFKDKYFALPGDMPNAVRYWGAQAGGTADGVDNTCLAVTTAATGTPTCNGDGNGMVSNTESLRFWQHLANAGLIEGSYAGIVTGTDAFLVLGKDVPRSRFPNAGWSVLGFVNATVGNSSFFDGTAGNVLLFGAPQEGDDPMVYTAVLKPEEAYNIDMKIDDGKPNLGKVITTPRTSSYTTNCVVSTNDAYALSYTSSACNLLFNRAF